MFDSSQTPSVPASVLALIESHLWTATRVDLVLLLAARPGRHWSLNEVSRELRISREQAWELLVDLAASGVLTRAGDGFALEPAAGPIADAVRDLTGLHPSHRTNLLRHAFSKANGPVRDFGDDN